MNPFYLFVDCSNSCSKHNFATTLEVAQAILQTLIERQVRSSAWWKFLNASAIDSVNNGIVTTEAVENALSGTWPHFFAVGLGLDLTVAQTEQQKGMVMSHE